MLAEFCSHTFIAENRKQRYIYGNFEEDYLEQGIFRVIKSNYKPHQKYLITLDKKNFTYNIDVK